MRLMPFRLQHAAPPRRALLMSAAIGCCILAGCATPASPMLRFALQPEAAPDSAGPTGVGVAASLEALPSTIDRGSYLAQLRQEYGLDTVVAGAANDLDRVRRLSRWARRQWEHNGDNLPTHPDPLSILAEARAGQRFRCVEYAEVLAAGLSAVGVPARVLGLQRADVETAQAGAGHVVAEAYLRDARRWVLVDGQWDVIPFRGAEPLDAVELQQALAKRGAGLRVESLSGTTTRTYARWIAQYLFYFVAQPRPWATGTPPGAVSLMLVPLGQDAPRVFQRRFAQPPFRATHSLEVFYAAPEEMTGR